MENIVNFLKSETLSHFIGEHTQNLFGLQKKASVEEARKLLLSKNILSAPILDEQNEYVGAVSCADLLRGLVRNLQANLGDGYLDNLASVPANELNNMGAFYATKPVSSVLHDADLWMKGDQSTNLMTVLTEGCQIQNARVHHRIYVCDPAKRTHKLNTNGGPEMVVNIKQGTEQENASSWVPTNVVSQLDIVRFLIEKKLANEISATIDELGLGKTVVYTVPETMPGLVAFHQMATDHKSAVGVTDASGKLIGSISVADLPALPFDNLSMLLRPLSELMRTVFTGARLDTVSSDMSFSALVSKMASEKIHRVYVVSPDGKAQSIITLTDILRVVSGCSLPQARRSLDQQIEWDEQRRAQLRAQGQDSMQA